MLGVINIEVLVITTAIRIINLEAIVFEEEILVIGAEIITIGKIILAVNKYSTIGREYIQLRTKIRKRNLILHSSFFVPIKTTKEKIELILNANGLNFVRMGHEGEEYKFLIDTGATISIIFDKFVDKSKINTSNCVTIKGITGLVKALGTANIALQIADVCIQHEFTVMNQVDADIHGIIGSDFLQKYLTVIDYEKFALFLNINAETVMLPIETNHNHFTILPPRCEYTKYFNVSTNDDLVVLANEICEGVFVARTLVRPIDGKIPVKILNTREETINLNNFTPSIDNLSNYTVCRFKENDEISVNRVDKVLELIKTEHLTKDEKFSLQRVCSKYADLFQLEDDPLTVTNVYQESIQLKPSTTPVYIKPYRLPQSQKEEIHSQIQTMLDNDIIEDTKSPWSSPLLLVPKKSEQEGKKKWRVVIDYRQLNKQIEDDKFPLPNICEILDSLSGAMYFTHLDLFQGYYQVELEEKSRKYTAFTTDRGQYQMKRLPMGLKISPSSFSRVMTIAMSGLTYDKCFVYLDDLIVFGNNLINHNKNLTKVLQRLREVNLKLNPYKCEFLKKELFYLGHIITPDGILPDPAKVKAVKEYPLPKDADGARRFVALANYYRRYIKNFADIASPLNYL
uniref:Reverse transcriptase domain-containing protein n=1 Tax=Photinus pyralis TaxID=7054 RepID=A0A1Y1KWY5_PHOPY